MKEKKLPCQQILLSLSVDSVESQSGCLDRSGRQTILAGGLSEKHHKIISVNLWNKVLSLFTLFTVILKKARGTMAETLSQQRRGH